MARKHSNMYYYDIVRKNIRKYRKLKGYTQQSLSEKVDMSMDYLAEIESTKRRKTFSIEMLGRIADTLEVPISKPTIISPIANFNSSIFYIFLYLRI